MSALVYLLSIFQKFLNTSRLLKSAPPTFGTAHFYIHADMWDVVKEKVFGQCALSPNPYTDFNILEAYT